MDEKKDPVDILDEIMSRSEQSLPSPGSPPPRFDPPEDIVPPPAAGAEKKAPDPAQRLLPWVLALLGGAVVALILLGFQLLSVNHRLDQLQADLEEVRTVDELRQENEKLSDQLTQQQEETEKQEQMWAGLVQLNEDLTYRTAYQSVLIWLEQFNREGDWLMSGTLVERMDGKFNPRNTDYQSDSERFILPSQRSRYLELREELFDKGGCMVVEGWSSGPDGGGYTERPQIAEGVYDNVDQSAAWALLTVLCYYPTEPDIAASFLAAYFQPDSEYLTRLYVGAFQPSTAALFEQVRSDLLAQGYLEENPDGTLSTVSDTMVFD